MLAMFCLVYDVSLMWGEMEAERSLDFYYSSVEMILVRRFTNLI